MTPEQIAASLSDAQRQTLRDAEWHGSGETQFATINVVGASLLPASLAHMFTLRTDILTPLGLAVRAAALRSRTNGDDV